MTGHLRPPTRPKPAWLLETRRPQTDAPVQIADKNRDHPFAFDPSKTFPPLSTGDRGGYRHLATPSRQVYNRNPERKNRTTPMNAHSLLESSAIDQSHPRHAEAQRLRNRIFGATLRQRRLDAQSSIDDIAETLGVETNLVEAWEFGDAMPSDNQLTRLAHHLDLPPRSVESPNAPDEALPLNADLREMQALRMRVRGALLRSARQSERLSIAQLSAAAGIHSDELTVLELGERSIPQKQIARLAAALNRDPGDFTPDAAGKQPPPQPAAYSAAKRVVRGESDHETRAIGDLTHALRQLPKPQLKSIAEALLAVAEARSNANGA